jgi:integrase/recombinase XerD
MPRHRTLAIEEAITLYLDDCRVQNWKPSTVKAYERSLRCFLRWGQVHDATQLTDFTTETVKQYIAHVQQQPKWAENPHVPTQNQRVSAITVRNYVRDLKAFASWLEREGYTEDNRLARVKKPRADEEPPDPFTQDELDRIFGSFDLTDAFDLRNYVILHTLWDTGMRAGELVDLTLDDVDLRAGEIRVDHANWGKWRDIGFDKQSQKYLSRYVHTCRPVPTIEGDRHFFLSCDGYPLSVNAIDHICQRISKRVGLRIHPHRFRHTFAVNMLRNGTDIRTLQKLMGHASLQILTRYLKLASDEAIETHRVNSPADKHYAQRQQHLRRLPFGRRPQ